MNSKQFNFLEYQHHLSTFGKKVLENLVKNLEERNECNKRILRGRDTYSQNKCVLNFGDSSIIPCQENVNEYQNKTLESNTSPRTFPREVTSASTSIATASGLLKAADIRTEMTSSTLAVVEERSSGRVPDNVGGVNNYVQWDDIFDTQLLNDLNILDTESNVTAQVDATDEGNIVKPCTEHENELCHSSKINDEVTKKSYENNIKSDCKNSLRYDDSIQPKTSENLGANRSKTKRRSANNISNDTPKKVKSALIDIPKHSLRKQKYTKSVKTWLNNAQHEQVMESERCRETPAAGPAGTFALEETTISGQKKASRKTVQAELKNKDGVMKYGKPRNIELPSKTHISHDGITVKDKKAKSKFVAPVKSRDVSYNIISLNEDNVEGRATVLSTVIDKEITMIITFRNGFCQLDSHYPEDMCEVEGAMFEIENVIYYWNNEHKTFWSTMGHIINQNTIVCFDGKNLLKYFASQCDIEVISTKVRMLDVQIGGALADQNKSMRNFSSVQDLLALVPEYTITSRCVQQRRAWHLAMLGECFVKLKSMLVEYDLWKVFLEIEMRVLPIVADMERRGVRVDTERLQWLEGRLARRVAGAERACHAAAGRAFQASSAAQVRSILYEELRLDVRGDVAVKETLCSGDKSTSEAVLRGLMALHPLPRLILEYRHVHKAHATFLAGIAHHVKDGLVTPTWDQTAAVTGRIACNNPNLQAIPKAPFSPVLFPAYTGEEPLSEPNETFNFRSVYIPREGHALLAADFKHIECRVFAYAAADTGLLDALASPDLFRVLAAKWLNKSEEDVSTEDRERTKRIVYASMYGAGTRKIMDILGVSYDKTLSIMASFNRTFPSLKSFGRAVVARCAQRGGRLATLCGRGRTFRHVFSDDVALRSHAERQAINFIVQGTAADLCKMAMVATTQRLRGAEPPIRGHLLLQIHDELVWEVELPDLDRAADEIKLAMEGIGRSCGVALPLPVAVSAGRRWGRMQPRPAPRQ